MMDLGNIDKFVHKLREKKAIADLDGQLLHLLIELQSDVEDEKAWKFLALCFSLWDDGNARILLDAEDFKRKWYLKWKGQVFLEQLAEGLQEGGQDDAESLFEEIIDEGVRCFQKASKMPHIVTVVTKPDKIKDATPLLPLVVDASDGAGALYLAKRFRAKLEVARSMNRLFKEAEDANAAETEDDLIKEMEQITDNPPGKEQADAVVRGVCRSLIVTGGPGTGKTTSVFYILWKLLYNEGTKDWQIYLAAPSGKAAERMTESLKNGLSLIKKEVRDKDRVACQKLDGLEGMTIHRLLKYSKGEGGFSYNKGNQFPNESIFVIDEASMIDVCLFASLLQAIPEGARVFILGDPYQLPSVDAGCVLNEILQMEGAAEYTAEITESRRSKDAPEIWEFATKIKNYVDVALPCKFETFNDTPWECAADGRRVFCASFPEAKTVEEKKKEKAGLKKILKAWVEQWNDFTELPSAAESLAAEGISLLANPKEQEKKTKEELETFKKSCDELWAQSLSKRILTAERQGLRGTEHINKTVSALVLESWRNAKENQARAEELAGSPYFPGQLLMVTRNQEMYRLWNGDTGIVLFKRTIPYIMLKKSNNSKLQYVAYPLSLIPSDAIESAFAITIHKSQGSEYDHVTMFLPTQKGHPLLNNQILYTGVTRAKKSVEIIATEEAFKYACETRIERDTGIEIRHGKSSA